MIKPIPKPGKPKKAGKSTAEKAHHDLVASFGCMICGAPACVHHIRQNGEPRDHKKVIPLCHYHHQGAEGIHFLGKRVWYERYGHEMDLLEQLNEMLKKSA